MRLIDADELNTHKFLTPQVKVIGGRRNGKTREKIIEAYQKGWNDCICTIVDNAPTVNPSLNLDNITEDDIEKFKMIWQRATSKGLMITTERPQGEWIIVDDVYCECPFCKNREVKFSKHCPECGARLKGGAE